MNTTSTEGRLESTAPAARPFYTRLAALGYALIGLVGVIFGVYSLVTGEPGAVVFVIPIVILALLIVGALLRFGAWAQLVAGLLSFTLLALVLPFSTFTLQHPEDAGTFIPLVVMVVGAAFAFVGCAVSLIQRRRHTLRAAATPAESLAVKVILAALVLVSAGSVALSVTSRTMLSAQVKANALDVNIKSFSFSPNQLEVKAGDIVRIVVRNSDPTLHTFTLPQVGVDVSVPPGSERLVEFKAPAPGEYPWYSNPHSDAGPNGTRTGMVGVLTVQ